MSTKKADRKKHQKGALTKKADWKSTKKGRLYWGVLCGTKRSNSQL
jgi:hypothetical protein